MRKIVLIPVFNEEETLLSVLEPLATQADQIVIVDDGSADRSLVLAQEYARRNHHVDVLHLPQNHGMSTALREGFEHLASQLQRGKLAPEDILLTLDADGQHDSGEIRGLCDHMEREALDVALTRRDFGLYPFHKRVGNLLMTVWGSLCSGHRYYDVESGFRALRLKVLPELLAYYTGYRYSCAQEIAVITARLGFRVDNRFVTVIKLYRSQTGVRDVIINAFWGLLASARSTLSLKVGRRPALARLVTSSESL